MQWWIGIITHQTRAIVVWVLLVVLITRVSVEIIEVSLREKINTK